MPGRMKGQGGDSRGQKMAQTIKVVLKLLYNDN